MDIETFIDQHKEHDGYKLIRNQEIFRHLL